MKNEFLYTLVIIDISVHDTRKLDFGPEIQNLFYGQISISFDFFW